MESNATQESLLASVPQAVHRFARVLIDATHAVYLVGGAVRNLLQGRPPGDWDIATNATPEQVQRLYPRTIPTGIRHGTVTVLFAGDRFEVTTFRTETTYSDGRRPDAVCFAGTIEEDLARRDFTINAIACDLASGAVRDPHDGRTDLSSRRLRTVGRARDRFAEDGLRPFRGCRLVAELGLSVDENTVQAMREAAPTARRVASERICEELRRLLSAHTPSVGLHLLKRSGLMEFCFGEPDGTELISHTDGETSTARYRRIDKAPTDVTRRLAMLLSPPAGVGLNPAATARHARAVLKRLRFPNDVVARVAVAINSLVIPITPESSNADLRRLIATVGRSSIEDVIAVREAINTIDAPLARRVRTQAQATHALTVRELSVDGTTLQRALGLSPGPAIGRLLEALLQGVLEDPSTNNQVKLLASARALLQQSATDCSEANSADSGSSSTNSE